MAKFLDKIGEMAKSAADKTNDLIEQSRLNSKINGEEAVIAELKEQIGNFYWQRYAKGEQTDNEIKEWCEAIKVSQATIAATRKELGDMKGEQGASSSAPTPIRCPICGAENPPSTKFCGECGEKLG